MEQISLKFVDKTTLTKYAPGVDPKDPTSIPDEVVKTERYLSSEETAMVIGMIANLQLDEIQKLEGRVTDLKTEVTELDRQRADLLAEITKLEDRVDELNDEVVELEKKKETELDIVDIPLEPIKKED